MNPFQKIFAGLQNITIQGKYIYEFPYCIFRFLQSAYFSWIQAIFCIQAAGLETQDILSNIRAWSKNPYKLKNFFNTSLLSPREIE